MEDPLARLALARLALVRLALVRLVPPLRVLIGLMPSRKRESDASVMPIQLIGVGLLMHLSFKMSDCSTPSSLEKIITSWLGNIKYSSSPAVSEMKRSDGKLIFPPRGSYTITFGSFRVYC